MNKAYSRIVWKNYPSEATPLNEQNLNKMDAAMDIIDGRVVTFASTKANQTDLLQSLKNVTYNETTGLFTFTWWNGTTKTVDLNIEKIPVSFSMSAAGVITMTNTDGTTYTADVSTLIKLYTFNTSSDIRFNTVTDASGNKTITAFIVNGSVTEEKLQPNFLANCRAQVAEATAQATKAQSYAEGGTGTRTGEDTDNAKYYYEQTQAISPAYDGIAVISDSTAPLTLPNSKRGGLNLTSIKGKWEQDGTPTPENPIEVIPVEIGEITEHGFNWWDEEWELGNISTSTGEPSTSSIYIRAIDYSKCVPNHDYYGKGGVATQVIIFWYDAEKNYIMYSDITNKTATSPNNAMYFKIRANTTTYNHDICINISNEALNGTYEPYHSATQQLSNPITLYGNDDVKDEIVRLDDGSLKVLRKYGQVNLGVLSWQVATNYFTVNKDYIRNATGIDIRRDMDGMLSCSFYRYMPGISSDHRLYQTNNAIRIRDDSYTDVTTFKASLDGVMLYYELAEPYYEDIPVVDQIALNSLETFDTMTYVDFNSDVEPTVSGEYGVSKVGGYTLKALLQTQSNGLRISELENAGG